MDTPARFRRRSGIYYHIARTDEGDKWTRLGPDREESIKLWHRVEAGEKIATKKLSRTPPRFRAAHGAYYHISRGDRQWTRLGTDRDQAILRWHAIEQGQGEGTFGATLDRYLRKLPSLGLADATVRNYRLSARSLRRVFGKTPIKKIEPKHVALYLDSNPHPTQANRDIALMSVVFSYAMRWGEVPYNPTRGVKRNKNRQRDRYATQEELERIKGYLGRLAPMIDLLYATGARKGDVLRLTWDDVTRDGLVIRPEKVKSNILLEWTPRLAAAVDACKTIPSKRESPYLLCTRGGRPYTKSGIDSIYQKARQKMKAAGDTDLATIHLHDIRGTSLTDLDAATGDVRIAQRVAGHKSVTMTEAYLRQRQLTRVRGL